jgi:hypothetical protein
MRGAGSREYTSGSTASFSVSRKASAKGLGRLDHHWAVLSGPRTLTSP